MVIANGLYNGLYDDIYVCMVILNGLYGYMQVCSVKRVCGSGKPQRARFALALRVAVSAGRRKHKSVTMF